MRLVLIPCLPGFISLFIMGCGGSSTQLDIPEEMPGVCRGVDFNLNVEMREMCGVKVRKYRAYKNTSQYRIMSDPKGGKIFKKGDECELRLPDMLPVTLPASFSGKIDFNEPSQAKYISSSYKYHEFLSKKNNMRVKMIKIDIPLNTGMLQSVCYTISGSTRRASKIQKGFANQLVPLRCDIFEQFRK
jgi:hypothetical protein